MAMNGERMKDAGDGDGKGGGEISTPSNSDLQELARGQGESDRGSGLLEEKEILTEKDMREKKTRKRKRKWSEKELKEMMRKEREKERKEKEKEEDFFSADTWLPPPLLDQNPLQVFPTWPPPPISTSKPSKNVLDGLYQNPLQVFPTCPPLPLGTSKQSKSVLDGLDQNPLPPLGTLRYPLGTEKISEAEREMREKGMLMPWPEKFSEEDREMREKGMLMQGMREMEREMGRCEMRERTRETEKMMMREKEEMEMLLNEKETEKELWKEKWKKMKEKEPKPLQVWEMEMEKCPYLLGRGPEGKGPVLYFFKKDEDGKRRRRPGMQVITPAESIRPPKYYNMSVVVGSVLYVLGGGALEHPENEQEDPENEQEWSYYNEVFLCDTNHPQKRWIKGPDMLNHRCNGKAVAVENKIYVFGGNNKTTRPWAEFLDPEKNKWEPLPPPPADSLIHTRDLLYNPVVYGDPGKGKIFLSCCYYIYDVNDQTWEEFCPPESLRPFSHNLTSDGNILYWSTFGHLYSFDMKTQDIDCGLVEGYRLSKYREEFPYPEPTLLHLDGDYFCFITLKDLPEDCTKVRCTKFQVSHQGGLKASVVYHDTYTIDCPLDIDCSYAFVLNGKMGAEKSEGSSVSYEIME